MTAASGRPPVWSLWSLAPGWCDPLTEIRALAGDSGDDTCDVPARPDRRDSHRSPLVRADHRLPAGVPACDERSSGERPGFVRACVLGGGCILCRDVPGVFARPRACHAIAARSCDLEAGRITLWLLGGATELPEDPPTPIAAFLVAGAGPAASLLLGGVVLGAAVLLASSLPAVVVVALTWLGRTNGMLALFNLLPGVPLDGGRIAEAIAWKITGDRSHARRAAGQSGRVLAAALVGMGL